MRLRDTIICVLAVIIAVALLFTAGSQLDYINAQRKEMRLISNEPLDVFVHSGADGSLLYLIPGPPSHHQVESLVHRAVGGRTLRLLDATGTARRIRDLPLTDRRQCYPWYFHRTWAPAPP